MSVAYACLLDVIRSISLVVQNTPSGTISDLPASGDGSTNEQSNIEDDSFSIQLVNSSWCGLLAALTLLLEARYYHREVVHHCNHYLDWFLIT